MPASALLLSTMSAIAQGGTLLLPPAPCEQSAPAQPSKHSQRRMRHTPWPEHELLWVGGG